MVGLQQKEKIIKQHEKYLHKIEITYPNINVINMKKSWNEAIENYNKFLDKYDEHVKIAEKTAVKGFEEEIKIQKENIEKVDKMSNEEKLKYWLDNFEEEKKAVEQIEKDKEEIIKKNIAESMKVLEKYKKTYEQNKKEKIAALKKWNNIGVEINNVI